jgi:hypothetical protein
MEDSFEKSQIANSNLCGYSGLAIGNYLIIGA